MIPIQNVYVIVCLYSRKSYLWKLFEIYKRVSVPLWVLCCLFCRQGLTAAFAGVLRRFFGKKHREAQIRFCLRDEASFEDGLDSRDILCCSSDSNIPTSEDVCHASIVPTLIDDIEISETSYISGCIGLSSTSIGSSNASLLGAGGSSVFTLEGFIGRFKSLRLRGKMTAVYHSRTAS